MSTTKRCTTCSQDKPVEDFCKNKASKDGRHYRCKECDRLARATHRGQTEVVSSKYCPQCGETKASEMFNKNRAQRDGLQTRCRMCEHGVDQKTCLDCDLPLSGYAQRCPEHQAVADARKTAQQEETRQRRESAAARRAEADLKAQLRRDRRCHECKGEIPEKVKLDARYCGASCRGAVNRRRQQADYAARQAEFADQDRAYRLANPRMGTLAAARNRAARLSLPFELAEPDLPEELGDCIVCERELVMGTRKVTVASPTIDRIVPELGYVPGNVLAWVCFSCNARKHNRTLADLADGGAGPDWQAWAERYLAPDS